MADDESVMNDIHRRLLAISMTHGGRYPEWVIVSPEELSAMSRYMRAKAKAAHEDVASEGPVRGTIAFHSSDSDYPVHGLMFRNVALRLAN